MDKSTLSETLKSKAMTLSLEEIQEIMDEELSKNPDEMDTQLIDLCADVLDKAYFDSHDEAVIPLIDSKSINKNTKNTLKKNEIQQSFINCSYFYSQRKYCYTCKCTIYS